MTNRKFYVKNKKGEYLQHSNAGRSAPYAVVPDPTDAKVFLSAEHASVAIHACLLLGITGLQAFPISAGDAAYASDL